MPTAKQLIKKIGLVVATSGWILSSMPAHAFIITGPIFDSGNFIENLGKQTADLEQRIKEEVTNQAERQLKKELQKAASSFKADSQASQQVAEQKLATNLKNHKVANENTPTPGLCSAGYYMDESGTMQSYGRRKGSILTFSMRGELYCEILSQLKQSEQKDMLKTVLEDKSVADKKSDVITENERLVSALLLNAEDEPLNVDDIIPHKKTGLSQEEFEVALDKAKVMFPPIIDLDDNNSKSDEQYLKSKSKSMRSMLPYQTQVDQITEKLKPSDEMLSESESQDMFAEDFMNTENIEKYTFKNMIMPSQVERDKAIMTAFLVHMSIQKYKSSLDKELLLSVRMLENIPD